jgi:uncharacterized DUF497 family protein
MAIVKAGDFEWDPVKATSNEIKHGVSFEEAVTAFFDERYLAVEDPQGHSDRFVLIGMSKEARVLYVVHVEIVSARRTRIISARLANKREVLKYAMGDAP